MPARADAHAHLFEPGYVDLLPDSCRLRTPDEATLYSAYANQHGIEQLLAIGYEGAAWAAGNNAYLARLAAHTSWVRPVAYVADLASITVHDLANWQQQGFVGISLYLTSEAKAAAVADASAALWAWLEDHRWLVSVNSQGELWRLWSIILNSHPDLCLLAAHLGLPPAQAAPPTFEIVSELLAPLLSLAIYPGVQVKLSAFYALTTPGYDYPHQAAWPFVEVLAQAFGVDRLLWGSDFSPALEHVSFAQTVGVIEQMALFTADERNRIMGKNLLALLNNVVTKVS
jgi:predicted TIM-barrel fold metal-dependent hydrolase